MKMPRSHSETENVQFVQELAEVDGPFESPININFKDLTKLELPALVWNRSEACPKKMKIANTGHTVIVSGKWKSERPYLSGGPLVGNYVFSQIHFHWGHEDCKGSEHLVSGEGFPLEMHVAHFKSDYMTQESALREKDGMVVLVYLFKIQEEPNVNLKKILNLLPSIKEAGSSQSLDPRPILCFCNPFTDDYFMYWGSVVTSTCAHILMWLVCREPFGISKDQVNEFRKILDSSQQPIFRNNRETQPLHKRNVFHVNASKNLDSPMLAIKKIVGCFCGRGMDDGERCPSRKDCSCPGSTMNQEDVEGTATRCVNAKHPRQGHTNVQRTVFVQRATVHSAPLLPKLLENTYFGQLWSGNGGRNFGQAKLESKSCCFVSMQELNDRKCRAETRKRKRQKSPDSNAALSNIMASLEALKKQTFKKLREIDLINREIKGMKNYRQKGNDKKWIRKVEKIMTRQMEPTVKSSQGCLTELKKLAKDCNVDQFFDGKLISMKESDKLKRIEKNRETRVLPYSMEVGTIENAQTSPETKSFVIGKAIEFSAGPQKLIRTFFEDIQETEEFHTTLKTDLNTTIHLISREKPKNLSPSPSQSQSQSPSPSPTKKGYITKKMFALENLGHRFFTEVAPDDPMENDGNDGEEGIEGDSEKNNMFLCTEEEFGRTDEPKGTTDSDLTRKETSETCRFNAEDIFPIGRVKNGKKRDANNGPEMASAKEKKEEEECVSIYGETINHHFQSDSSDKWRASEKFNSSKGSSEELISGVRESSSNASTDSAETQRMIVAKFHKKTKRNEISVRRSSHVSKLSSKGLYKNKSSKKRRKFNANVNFEGYYVKSKKANGKKKKIRKRKPGLERTDTSCDLSAISKEDFRWMKRKCKWRHMTKTRFKLKIEKTSDSATESAIEFSLLRSSNREKIKFGKRSGKTSARSGDFEKGTDSNAAKKFSSGRREKSAAENQRKEAPEAWKDGRREGSETEKGIGIRDKAAEGFDENEKIGGTHRSDHDSGSGKGFERRRSDSGCREKTENETKGADSNSKAKNLANAEPRFESIRPEIREKKFNDECGEKENGILEPGKKLEIVKRYGAGHGKAKNFLSKGASLESYQAEEMLKMEPKSGRKGGIKKLQEFEIGFVTAPKQFFGENLPSFPQFTEQGTGITGKSSARCDIEKYHFLDKEMNDVKMAVPQNESVYRGEEVKKSVSENSIESALAADTIKGNSVSCGKIEMNSVNDSNSRTKRPKGKRKKRRNLSKKMSTRFGRKIFAPSKKPNNVGGKPIHFLGLSNEEQLKIISAKVAKYIREKLEERKRNFDSEKDGGLDKTETETRPNTVGNRARCGGKRRDSATNEEAEEKKEEEIVPSHRSRGKIYGRKENAGANGKEKLDRIPSKEIEKKSTATKPPLNFIKLNKLMAGKYKKATSSPKEIITKIPILKSKQKESNMQKKKREKPSAAARDTEEAETEPKPNSRRRLPVKKINVNTKGENSDSTKKFETNKFRSVQGEKKNSDSKMANETGENFSEESATDSAAAGSTTSLVPARFLNAILSAGTDNERHRQQINQFLLNVKTKSIDSFLPEPRVKYYDSKKERKESAFAKDLENLIRLQLCLNTEIAANIENSMNYIRTVLGRDSKDLSAADGAAVGEKVESRGQSGLVLIEMDDIMDWSSSGSDTWDEKDAFDCLDVSRGKTVVGSRTEIGNVPDERPDSKLLVFGRDSDPERDSESNYNCEISITLNGGSNEFDDETRFENWTQILRRKSGRIEGGDEKNFLNSEKSSRSLVFKPMMRKRDGENEISIEMKRKLLEILEGEMRREMGRDSGNLWDSSENSSDALPLKWEEGGNGTGTSQSGESGSENAEMLAQISETMRQYLREYKTRKNLKDNGNPTVKAKPEQES